MAHPVFVRPMFALVISGVILTGAGAYAALAGSHDPAYRFVPVNRGSITRSASVSGAVQAAQNATLSFQSSGRLARVDAKAGDEVKRGQVIAALDHQDADAAIAQADAELQAAQANEQKVLGGATDAQTAVAKAALASAEVALRNATKNVDLVNAQQDTAVANASRALFNTAFSAVPGTTNTDGVTLTVSGTYVGTKQGAYAVRLYETGAGMYFTTSGLEDATGFVSAEPVSLGANGLFLQFSAVPNDNDTWTISVPNTAVSAYTGNENAYQSAQQAREAQTAAAEEAVASAQAAVGQAQAQEEAVVAPARPEDAAAARAQVAMAQAAVQAAQVAYAKGLITAPFAGRIGSFGPQIGDVVSPGQAVGTLVSDGAPQMKVPLSDADLALARVGDAARVTFGAYPDDSFAAVLTNIDATPLSGNASVHQATLVFDQADPRLVPGLSGDAVIGDRTDAAALLAPASSVIADGGQKFLLVRQTDGSAARRAVQVGITDGTQVEILSGVSAGDQVAAF